MKATAEPGSGLHAQVHTVGAQNITALAELLSQGNGVFLVTVHKRRIVNYARVDRPVQPASEPKAVNEQT